MGFFKILQWPSPPRAIEHDVSFDLTTAYPPRKFPTLLASRTSVDVPLEIVLNILEAAYYDDDLNLNTALLSNASLVCKAWSPHAQKLLFRHVTLRTQTACIAFQHAVDRSTDRGRILGDAVLRLQAVLDHNQPFRLSQLSFARAVTLCPNLYELNLSLFGCGAPGKDVVGIPDMDRMRRIAPSFDEHTLRLLRSGPQISALQFNNWSENQESIMQLLEVWSSLKYLSIGGTAPQLPSHLSFMPANCALHELRMNFQTQPSVNFLKWLLHNSTASLRILELERDPTADLLEYLVGAHGATLHSLAIPSCGAHEYVQSVQECHALRELRTESPWVSPVVYRRLAQDIEHVAFSLDLDTALQSLLELVKSRDNLRAVTVNLCGNGDRHPQLPALQMACAYRGVELRMTRDVRDLRKLGRGDPVAPEVFPRIKSFSNLRLMQTSYNAS